MSGIPIRVNPTHREEVDDSNPEVQVVNLQVNADSNETIRNVSLNGVVSTICNSITITYERLLNRVLADIRVPDNAQHSIRHVHTLRDKLLTLEYILLASRNPISYAGDIAFNPENPGPLPDIDR